MDKQTKQYVAGFMYSQDKKSVVLIEKLNPAWQRGLLNGVGGKIEKGETPQIAMAREFEEEAGVSTLPEDWEQFAIINGGDDYRVYFFYTISDSLKNAKSMEAEKISIHEIDNLPPNVIHNLKWLIPMSLDEKLTFSNPIMIEEDLK